VNAPEKRGTDRHLLIARNVRSQERLLLEHGEFPRHRLSSMTDISSSHQEIQALVDELQARYARVDDGEVATYIPELSKVNPDEFGVSLITASGSGLRIR
jgi:hypothetical protein